MFPLESPLVLMVPRHLWLGLWDAMASWDGVGWSEMQVFLLTNSLWEYTHVVMNFLCGKSRREDRTTEWLDLFDVAIVGACKVCAVA